MGRRALVSPGRLAACSCQDYLSAHDTNGPTQKDTPGGDDYLGLTLQLLRSETVEVYVNNEKNILVSFFLSPLRFHTHSKCALV